MVKFLEQVSRVRPLVGCFAFLPSPASVEILALAGFDFVIVDREHSPKDWSVVENMVRAAEARGISALVRVSENSRVEIMHALECGADGVVVSGVSSADDAASAVSAMRFPPEGQRGACPISRAANYGASDFASFRGEANKSRALLLTIEDISVLSELDSIVSASGPHVSYMLGRSDLAASMGHFGEPTADPVVAAADGFLRDISAAQPDAPIGMGVYSPDEVSAWATKGCSFFWYMTDVSMLLGAARDAVTRMTALLPRR